MKKIIRKIKSILEHKLNNIEFDNRFLFLDKNEVLRTKAIKQIPNVKFRRGGKVSYAEWSHVIGIFQTILYQELSKHTSNNILDVGCGSGLLSMSCEPFIDNGGLYIGMDVMKSNIEFANSNYTHPNIKFEHFNVNNPTYASGQINDRMKWPLAENSFDMITALSVWTHLSEEDAIFYFNEVARVLVKGGKAMITFFYLDDKYEKSLSIRKDEVGRYHSTNQKKWIFSESAYESENWFSPKWVKVPEDAIGIDKIGMNKLLLNSGLKLCKYYPGNWKEIPGVYFQDILIFEKK